jgi:hypothetical protein
MLYRDRKPINFDAKTAKYMALKKNDNPRFLSKIAKLEARKNAWWAVQKAVDRYENFKDSEDDTPWLVRKQHEHVIVKYGMYTRVRDEEEKKEEKEAAVEEKEEKEVAVEEKEEKEVAVEEKEEKEAAVEEEDK